MSVTLTKTNTWKLTTTGESFIQVLKKKKRNLKEIWKKKQNKKRTEEEKNTNLLCNKILFLTSTFYNKAD